MCLFKARSYRLWLLARVSTLGKWTIILHTCHNGDRSRELATVMDMLVQGSKLTFETTWRTVNIGQVNNHIWYYIAKSQQFYFAWANFDLPWTFGHWLTSSPVIILTKPIYQHLCQGEILRTTAEGISGFFTHSFNPLRPFWDIRPQSSFSTCHWQRVGQRVVQHVHI